MPQPVTRSVAAPTRIGLVGLNDRARRLLVPGLLASPRAQLAAVISRDLEKARVTAAALGPGIRAFTRLEEALHGGVLDALYVNTPLETHVAICSAALEAGMAIICEKPLAPTLAEATALAERAGRAGVRTAVNFTYRSVPGYRLCERWLAQHSLGRPLHASFELLQGHNFFPGFVHGSALLDSGSHLFDLMAAMLRTAGFGDIVSVQGTALSAQTPDYGWAFHARTASGVVAQALFSRSVPGWRNGLRWTLAGEAGAIDVELDASRTSTHATLRAGGGSDAPPQGARQPLPLPDDLASDDARFPAYHMDRLVRAIRGEEAFPTFAEAVLANRLAQALATSAMTGAWVAP